MPLAPAQTGPRLVGLDLLRGMAAYAVVTAHCAPALAVALGPGVLIFTSFLSIAGVELFFALSGFLIGGILLELEPTARNLGIFVLRRWFRTLPVYYVVLAVFLAFPGAFHAAPPDAPWRYVVFLQNITNDPKFFSVSWSLSVEEWFYLLLPLCLLLRMRYLHVIFLFIAAGILARLFLAVDVRASVAGRLDAIAWGCMAAWLMRSAWQARIERHAGAFAIAGAVGMTVAFSSLVFLVDRMQYARPFGAAIYTLLPLSAAMTVPFFAKLRIGSPVLAGAATFGAAVSYPVYLVNDGLVHLVSRTLLHPGRGLLHVAAVFLVATAAAYVLHVLVERPFMRLRPGLPRGGRVGLQSGP